MSASSDDTRAAIGRIIEATRSRQIGGEGLPTSGIYLEKTYAIRCQGCGRELGTQKFPAQQIVLPFQLEGYVCNARCERKAAKSRRNGNKNPFGPILVRS